MHACPRRTGRRCTGATTSVGYYADLDLEAWGRETEGLVLRNNEVNDDQQRFVASGEFTAPKARVLLQVGLTKTSDVKQLQRMFDEY